MVPNDKKKPWAPIVFGQILAFVVALGAVCTKMLYTEHGFSSPALQNLLGYGLTFLCFAVPCVRNHKLEWKHALAVFFVSIADSQAGFIGSLAYRYGVSIASVGMLSSFTIPCAMFFSYLFLHVRYERLHYLGCLVAFLGLVLVVIADVVGVNSMAVDTNTTANEVVVDTNTTTNEVIVDENYDPVFADFLIIIGSAVYAAANVGAEKFVKTRSLIVYLAWLCMFGTLISIVEVCVLELSSFTQIEQDLDILSFFLPGGVIFCVLYYAIGRYLQEYDAVMFNLSLLTTDVWGIVFGSVLFSEEIHVVKFLGFAFIVTGVYVYNKRDPIRPPEEIPQDEEFQGIELHESPKPNEVISI